MIKARRITVAEYLTQQINITDKSQKELAEDAGYDKPNIITMFKQGKTKLPINKVPLIAKSLGLDPVHLLRIVMTEYMPETWEVIERLIGGSLVSEDELAILDIVRTVSGGQLCAPRTEEDARALAELCATWRDRADASAEASRERKERDKGKGSR